MNGQSPQRPENNGETRPQHTLPGVEIPASAKTPPEEAYPAEAADPAGPDGVAESVPGQLPLPTTDATPAGTAESKTVVPEGISQPAGPAIPLPDNFDFGKPVDLAAAEEEKGEQQTARSASPEPAAEAAADRSKAEQAAPAAASAGIPRKAAIKRSAPAEESANVKKGKPAPAEANGKSQKDKSTTAGKGDKAKREKPPTGGFFATHPIRAVPATMPPSLGSRAFDLIAYVPWLFLILMLVAQTIFSLDSRALWFSDEVRHADAFRNLLEHGKGIVLQMNGLEYLDKPPLYFWFLRGLYEILKVEGPLLDFTAAAVSGLLFVLSFLLLGRFVDRADGRTLTASGIVLVCSGYVYALLHYARMDFLFAACIICAYVALYHALIRPRSVPFSLTAFFLMGVACLVKGPLGFGLPLTAGIFFVLWQRRPRRLLRSDILLGLAVFLAEIAAWAVLVYMDTGSLDVLTKGFWHQQIVVRAIDSFAHREPWWFYLPRLPLLFLPFVVLIFCLPWTRLASRGALEHLRSLRRAEGEGRAFLWCIALSALVLLSCVSGKVLIYYLPAMPAVALLIGRACLEISGIRARLFRLLMGLVPVIGGVAFLLASLILFGAILSPSWLDLPGWRIAGNLGFYVAGFGLIAGGLFLLLGLRSSRPESVLLGYALVATLLSYPLARDVAPAFDQVLSPKAQSLILKSYMDKGYQAFSYRNYPGIYAYYAGTPVKDVDSLAELPPVPGEHGVVLAIRRKDLNDWPGKPACFKEVDARYIEHPERVLLVCPGRDQQPPAPPVSPTETTQPPQTPPTEAQQPAQAPPMEAPQPPHTSQAETPRPGQHPSPTEPVQPGQAAPAETPQPEQTPPTETPRPMPPHPADRPVISAP